MLRYLLLFILFYLMVKLIKPILVNFLFGSQSQPQTRTETGKKKDDFQRKHQDKIEDADYEEIE